MNQSVANEGNDHADGPCEYWTDRRLDERQKDEQAGRQADRQQSTDKRAPNDSQEEGNICMQQLSLSHFLFVLVLAKPITSGWVGDF